MPTPFSNRPKITKESVSSGYVTRYFTKPINENKITEIDQKQYDRFINNPYFQSIQLLWYIKGSKDDTKDLDGRTIRGVRSRNQEITKFYETKLPGLSRMLLNPLEYYVEK